MLLPRWRAQRRARRRAMDLQCAAIDQEIGSPLDAKDRLVHIQDEVARLRRAAMIIEGSACGTSDGSFARGALWGYDRVLELFDED